ncbi:MAG: hypothetical protein HWE10_09470 [Gammaproteobacteria bacterium]|nr:hypothetical protein [Gammaproteobacteria bacterium]
MDKPVTANTQSTSKMSAPHSSAKWSSGNVKFTNLNINQQGIASLRLQNSQTLQQFQLTPQQALLMRQQAVLMKVEQQQLQLFLQSQLLSKQMTLPNDIARLVTQWITKQTAQNKTIDMPSKLAQLLSNQSDLPPNELKERLNSIAIKNNLLEFTFLQGAAIHQLKPPSERPVVSTEQLQNTLQILLPLGLATNDTVMIKQQEQAGSKNSHTTNNSAEVFNMTFDLKELGLLVIAISINDFKLETQCNYSNVILEQKVKRLWPMLEERLTKLGFEVTNQFKFKPELESSNTSPKHTGIINTQV